MESKTIRTLSIRIQEVLIEEEGLTQGYQGAGAHWEYRNRKERQTGKDSSERDTGNNSTQEGGKSEVLPQDCGRQPLRRTDSAKHSSSQHTLQEAMEPRRSWAHPLTLCLLRMKREDFITSCKTTPPVSLLPTLSPSSPPPSLLPRFTSTLPASSTVQKLSQPKEGSRLPKKTSTVQCTERGGQGQMKKEIRRQESGTYHLAYTVSVVLFCQ
ncbi:hypothetical protein Q8A73_004756 [Channa argus]|nr:hypothetical protein Q8A73_004756 [Channa argus]